MVSSNSHAHITKIKYPPNAGLGWRINITQKIPLGPTEVVTRGANPYNAIPTRGAIQRGEAEALDDDILSNITDSTDACTDGSCSLAYLVRTGLGSALHYVEAAAGRCYLAQASAADPKSRKQALSIDREG